MHTPRHARSLAELGDDELAHVAEAWRRRREAEPDGYLHALVNEGREAGSSLPHTHSQLVWLPEPAAGDAASRRPRAVERRRRARRPRRRLPAREPPPYEVVIAPAEPRANALRATSSSRRAPASRRDDPALHAVGGRRAAERVAARLGRLAHRAAAAPDDPRRSRARRRLVDQRRGARAGRGATCGTRPYERERPRWGRAGSALVHVVVGERLRGPARRGDACCSSPSTRPAVSSRPLSAHRTVRLG